VFDFLSVCIYWVLRSGAPPRQVSGRLRGRDGKLNEIKASGRRVSPPSAQFSHGRSGLAASTPSQRDAEREHEAGDVWQHGHEAEPEIHDVVGGELEAEPRREPQHCRHLWVGVSGDRDSGRHRHRDGVGECGERRAFVGFAFPASRATDGAFRFSSSGGRVGGALRSGDSDGASIRNRIRAGDDSGAPGGSVAEVQLREAERRERGAHNGGAGYDPRGEGQHYTTGMPQRDCCGRQREGETVDGDAKAGERPCGQRSGAETPSGLRVDAERESTDRQSDDRQDRGAERPGVARDRRQHLEVSRGGPIVPGRAQGGGRRGAQGGGRCRNKIACHRCFGGAQARGQGWPRGGPKIRRGWAPTLRKPPANRLAVDTMLARQRGDVEQARHEEAIPFRVKKAPLLPFQRERHQPATLNHDCKARSEPISQADATTTPTQPSVVPHHLHELIVALEEQYPEIQFGLTAFVCELTATRAGFFGPNLGPNERDTGRHGMGWTDQADASFISVLGRSGTGQDWSIWKRPTSKTGGWGFESLHSCQ
jgi:hypothetical protein